MTTLARPYALAAFECAQENKALSAWENMLATAALVANDARVARLMDQPEVTAAQLSQFFADILANLADKEKMNFIQLLAEKKRLPLLPEIASLFKSYRAAIEQTISVEVLSAAELGQPMKNKIMEALQQRLKQNIVLECQVDPALIGGLMIRAGDQVMDGSIQGKLKRLLDALAV